MVNSGSLIHFLADNENERATKDVREPNFTLYYPISFRILIILSSIVFFMLSILSVLFIEEDMEKIAGGSFFGLFFFVSLASTFYYKNWRLKFDEYGLIYSSGFGKKQELRYAEVHSVYETAGNLLLKTEDISIHIPSYMIGMPVFLSRLEREHFEIVSQCLGRKR